MAKKVNKKTKKKAPARKKAASTKKAAPKAKKANKKTVTKKKTTKKAAAGKKTVKRNAKARSQQKGRKKTENEKLTPKEIEGYRRLLLEKWVEILGDVSYIENEALRKSRLDAAGDLSSMPIHMADLGTDNFEQEFSLGLMDSERKILVEIVAALRRIADGTFGICEGTGKPISKARLQANPWARYSIEYARMVEKGIVEEGEKVYPESEETDEDTSDDETDEHDEDYDEESEEETNESDYDDDADDGEDDEDEEFAAVDDDEDEDEEEEDLEI